MARASWLHRPVNLVPGYLRRRGPTTLVGEIFLWCRMKAFTSRGLRLGSVFLLAVSLSGCAGHRHDAGRLNHHPSAQTIYSPNGEPLDGGPLGSPSCVDAMTTWFNRVDTNHDHAIDLAEFLADARRQFALMDLNHDGEITPDELATYRAPYEVDGVEPAPSDVDKSETPDRTRGRRRGESASAGSSGSHKVDLSNDAADPVMSADVNLKFKVSLDDFLAYEKGQFDQLDTRHSHRLTTTEILTSCPSDKAD
jgi:hypothetical protein